jgi:serine/threonine protein kinase
VLGTMFTVEGRYTQLKAVGKGSYGIVCSALDVKSNKKVAIKKITPMAQHAVDAKHVLREIRLMRYLGAHPNIISLEDVAVREYEDELYIVMELLDSDLHRIIQSPQGLSDAHFRYFMYQLLRGVRFLHDNRIIHRDLKPGNLLVTKSCQLRITDFGLARARPAGRGHDPDDEVDDPMTEHVVTRWYRPPELMLCPDGLYTYAVDLWSVGCILAEMLGRCPLFPGRNFVDQLTLIFDVVGSPEPHQVAHIQNGSAVKFLESMMGKTKKSYRQLFPQASEQAVDLLEGLLVFDPPDRLTVHEAINHPYFDPLSSNDDTKDPVVSHGLEFEFETEPLARLQLKQLILQEVDSFRREKVDRERLGSGGRVGEDVLGSRSSRARGGRAAAAELKDTPASARGGGTRESGASSSATTIKAGINRKGSAMGFRAGESSRGEHHAPAAERPRAVSQTKHRAVSAGGDAESMREIDEKMYALRVQHERTRGLTEPDSENRRRTRSSRGSSGRPGEDASHHSSGVGPGVGSNSSAGSSAGGVRLPAKRRMSTTVPKSPSFTKMSWQREETKEPAPQSSTSRTTRSTGTSARETLRKTFSR